jgi:hypothetical protein
MSYRITRLARLPVDDDVDFYIFCIGDDPWKDGLGAIIRKNFDNLGHEIGPQAVLVGGFDEYLEGEVVAKYFGDRSEQLVGLMPAILVTNAHPERLDADSLRFVIPLRKAQEQYRVIDDFLADLAAFARGESDRLLTTLEDAPTLRKAAKKSVKVSVPVVPGFVSIDARESIIWLRRWWKRNRKKRDL